MARRASSLAKTAVGIERDIGSEYDNVRAVADNLNSVNNINNNLDIVEFVSQHMSEIIDVATILGQEGLAAQSDLDALEEIVTNQGYEFRIQATAPTQGLVEGMLWYNVLTNDMLIYREVAPGSLQWASINVNDESTDSDIIDAGAF
jgi:hypothetical protein